MGACWRTPGSSRENGSVTDEVDITAKDLPKVESATSEPSITAPVRARPGLLVGETKDDLSSVDEHKPAATLTLDEEPANTLDEESSVSTGKALAKDLPDSEEAKRHATKQRRAGRWAETASRAPRSFP